MADDRTPTNRELEILKILWERGEASVREVYEAMRAQDLPIAQNTVQAFLRTMEEKKGLVRHRAEGRTFIYRPVLRREDNKRRMLSRVLHRVFDGAIDQLVQSALSLRSPTPEELAKLEAILADAAKGKPGGPRGDAGPTPTRKEKTARQTDPERGNP